MLNSNLERFRCKVVSASLLALLICVIGTSNLRAQEVNVVFEEDDTWVCEEGIFNPIETDKGDIGLLINFPAFPKAGGNSRIQFITVQVVQSGILIGIHEAGLTSWKEASLADVHTLLAEVCNGGFQNQSRVHKIVVLVLKVESRQRPQIFPLGLGRDLKKLLQPI
jgi:hypothetical protein